MNSHVKLLENHYIKRSLSSFTWQTHASKYSRVFCQQKFAWNNIPFFLLTKYHLRTLRDGIRNQSFIIHAHNWWCKTLKFIVCLCKAVFDKALHPFIKNTSVQQYQLNSNKAVHDYDFSPQILYFHSVFQAKHIIYDTVLSRNDDTIFKSHVKSSKNYNLSYSWLQSFVWSQERTIFICHV